MLDMRKIRQNPEEVRKALEMRNQTVLIDQLLKQDEERLALLAQAEEKKALRNQKNKQIGIARKNGASKSEIAHLMDELRMAGSEIDALDGQIANLDKEMNTFLLALPNLPHPSVPVGASGQNDVEVRLSGAPRVFAWEPKSHEELRKDLKLEQSNAAFGLSVFHGMGACLKDALSRFFKDAFRESGYDLMLLEDLAASLPVKSELSILKLYDGMVFQSDDLPKRACACIPNALGGCFEVSQIVLPTQTGAVLESMVSAMECALLLVGLPSRTVEVCAGRLDFDASKSYALEVWMPSLGRYVKAAVCSDSADFLARRFNIRFRSNAKDKPRTAHTLCGRLSLDCVFNAILENLQNDDGTVAVPASLVSAMGTKLICK